MVSAGTWAQTDRPVCTYIYESSGFKLVRTTSLMKANLLEPQETEINQAVSVRESKMTEDDIVLINRLDNEAFKEHFNHRPLTVEETEYMLTKMPWYGRQRAWFASLQNQAVGYIVAGIDEGLNREKHVRYGWINDIGVLKPYRRQRIGAALMHTAMRHLRSQGMFNALLYVDDQNITGAAKLYEAVGFKLFHANTVYERSLV
jgi:ribosomal protein S18 acetylase RimI-like enzyme